MSIYTSQLQQFYMIYLGRPADPDGLAYWESAAASGHGMDAIAASFASSSEFGTQHAGQSHRDLLNSIYLNLFDRQVEKEGVDYWSAALDHGMTADQVGLAILRGAQPADAATIAAKTAAATSYTDMLAQQDAPTASALLAKSALWLSTVTDAASQAAATAGLNDFAAHAFKPVVLDVDAKYDWAYTRGTVEITVNFSDAVTVDTTKGTPTLRMETGADDDVATYVSGSGTNQLVFAFTIKADDATSDLDYTSSGALSLNGATIRDAANHDAVLTLAAPGASNSLSANRDIVIDTTPPLLTSLSPADHDSVVSPDANIEFQFNEPVSYVIGNIYFIIREASGKLVLSLDYSDSPTNQISLSADGKTITIDPEMGLLPHTSYTVSVHGFIHDIAGNDLGAGPFNPDGHGYKPYTEKVMLRFTTGDAPTPTLSAGVGADAGTLQISGASSGNQLVIDLNKHTTSEGTLPAGAFTAFDTTDFNSGIKLQALDGAHNTLTGTPRNDTLIGGNAVDGVAAVNVLRGGEGADVLVAGAGSDNNFHYTLPEFYIRTTKILTDGKETIGNWAAGHSNTISFDDLTLTAGSGDGSKLVNGNFPTTMHINANGLAVFDSLPTSYDQVFDNSAEFYLSWYVSNVLKTASAGTSAVFNYKDDAFLLVMDGTQRSGYPDFQVIKVTGVHSDGLVFDANGNVATGTFVGNH